MNREEGVRWGHESNRGTRSTGEHANLLDWVCLVRQTLVSVLVVHEPSSNHFLAAREQAKQSKVQVDERKESE